MGFDNSPISREAVSLLVEQMNERKKRRPTPLEAPIHKVIPPVLIRWETTEKNGRIN